MAEPVHLDVILNESPGSVLTGLMLRLSAEHGVMLQPRVTLEGTRLPLPQGPLSGRCELIVSAVEDGTRVQVVGARPMWPFSMGFARRVRKRYLGSGPIIAA